jgi:hypothetical protein
MNFEVFAQCRGLCKTEHLHHVLGLIQLKNAWHHTGMANQLAVHGFLCAALCWRS